MLRGKAGLVPRPTHARPVIDPDHCTGCGWCLPVCAPNVLSLVIRDHRGQGSKQSELVRAEDCTGCAHCAVRCPHGAIRMVQAAVARPKA
jgi:ferredoxin